MQITVHHLRAEREHQRHELQDCAKKIAYEQLEGPKQNDGDKLQGESEQEEPQDT